MYEIEFIVMIWSAFFLYFPRWSNTHFFYKNNFSSGILMYSMHYCSYCVYISVYCVCHVGDDYKLVLEKSRTNLQMY